MKRVLFFVCSASLVAFGAGCSSRVDTKAEAAKAANLVQTGQRPAPVTQPQGTPVIPRNAERVPRPVFEK